MTYQKHTKEAYHFADMILQASGSSLCYYSMDKTRTEILDAAQKIVDQLTAVTKQRDDLRDALSRIMSLPVKTKPYGDGVMLDQSKEEQRAFILAGAALTKTKESV